MHAKKFVSLLAAVGAAAVVACICATAQADEQRVTSKIESVVLYRGQALVTRVVNLPEADGEMQIVVPDLPEQTQGGSLFAAGDAARVRAVRYRMQAVAAAPKKEVAEIDAKIRELEDRNFANKQTEGVLDGKTKYLDKLEGFTAPTVGVEMAKGVLDAKQISELSEYVFKKRQEIANERVTLMKAARDIGEEVNLLRRKRGELAAGMSRTERQAAIFLNKPAKGAAQIRLSYVVEAATWTPSYEFRLNGDGQTANMEYSAQVQQTSGEDWTDVKLTLSTATPAMNAEIPLLTPMWIALEGVENKGAAKAHEQLPRSLRELSDQQAQAAGAWNGRQNFEIDNWELNRLGASKQELELNASRDILQAARVAPAIEEGLAVTYEIAGKMNISSRNDTQLVQIMSAKIEGKSFYEAIPLLTTYVYRGLEIVNTTENPLLAGSYSAYVGGEFVGGGKIPLVAKGQNLAIGFGVDTQLHCWRELKDKTAETKLGSKVDTYNYVLHVESYKDKPVDVRLIDRMPVTKGQDMETKIASTSLELSADPEYAGGQDKEKGILRWDVPAPAGSHGAKDVKIQYSFEVKYARDRAVGAAPSASPVMMEEMKREYDARFKAAH
jgi:uncharacterized protein (TIGR02231 family)